MSIGEALAQARHQAGLTVGQVSGSTRIRETIIRDIERDDYSACGGDFYARGHIRAIAEVVHTDAAPLIAEYDSAYRAPEIPAASVFEPVVPIRLRERPRVNWSAVLAVLVVAALGVGGYFYIAGGKPAGRAVGAGTAGAAGAAGKSSSRHHGSQSSPKADPPAKPPVKSKVLRPVTATAVGQGGVTGDDSLGAPLAIDGSLRTAWQTSIYTTAQFGNLERGTGLLLDLGKLVTVTSVRLNLGKGRGAAVDMRVGNSPGLTGMVVVASARNARGSVALPLAAPVRARYVLIWFTKLPANPFGGYEAKVYNVKLRGRSGRLAKTASAN
ncbi:MAG TPA: helix-turn-helix domain-containing protein [Streptosporangiaceae bacterium]|nr:helix-turn-helix domain-containing protein [Streptosporangiaceae bacterium]